MEPLIGIADFKKVELVVGKVVEAADHPNANRLLVLKVDIGEPAPRQIVAGIKEHYPPAELVGKRVIIIANLQPAQLRGVESQGMVLAASGEGKVVVLTVDKEVPVGSKVS